MASPSVAHRPSLVRLETKAVEEDARSKSTRQLWRQLFEELCEWLRARGDELIYAELDGQLTGFLREKYFEGKPRSFAVNAIRAVKFEVPAELGRDSLGRARNAAARWDTAPFVELDLNKVRAAGLQAMGTSALCNFIGASLGLNTLLQLRGSAKGITAAVDGVLYRAFKDHFPHIEAENWRGCKPLRQDLHAFLKGRGDAHPALRLVVRDSPALLQLEMAGSAAFQMDGAVALFGQDIFELNLDTIGLWFGTKSHKDVQLLQESNLEKGFALEASQTEVSDLGQRLRRPLDPQQVSDAVQLLNPSSLSTLLALFPDAKYDVALVQDTFEHYNPEAPYAQPDTGWLDRIRGKPHDCYLSNVEEHGNRGSGCNHLLKTQKHLDPARVEFYTKQLKEALAAGSPRRPTALVLDFFNEGLIHKVQPDEDDKLRGPGGRRLQTRAREACEKGYMDNSVNKMKTWILLDGHHKVEAAARLGCTINFLVVSPCAEPYEPLSTGDEFASLLSKSACFPQLWPSNGCLVVDWEAARLCSCVAMRLSSSRQLSEAWACKQGCPCFEAEDSGFPPWVCQMLRYRRGAISRSQVIEHCKRVYGPDSELFTTYRHTRLDALPEDLQMQLFQEAFQLPG